MINPIRLDPQRSLLLVIDIQEKLLPLIDEQDRLVHATRMLISGAEVFDLPILVTEQYPEGIGPTVAALADDLRRVKAEVLPKKSFSAWGEESVIARLRELDREQIIVCGIETHVCIQQTTMDLLTLDYQVFVCADAVGSRRQLDYDTALHRMRSLGAAVTTVESVLFELCERCDSPRFKQLLEIIKAGGRPPAARST